MTFIVTYYYLELHNVIYFYYWRPFLYQVESLMLHDVQQPIWHLLLRYEMYIK